MHIGCIEQCYERLHMNYCPLLRDEEGGIFLWDSIKWLIPSVKAPTWTDGLAAILIAVVGLVILFLVIRPIVMKSAKFLE
ncbi:MAG: hypothetical protein RR642_10905 [Solibacillus sp.]